ncbi:hypothetical protein FEQ05_05118 [Burkholderia pseudomultivorans]|uniref:Tc1-like transposase DDE domain-containing protein n=1 Tax=Burkholderia pseudomultivorans TaxID=1207504 RepID=A0ABU2ECA9_9BURK|nr:hypothetical protein [Burkholderia pseudomultivorans]TCT27169.1 transposase [Burkholderia vietnamiensis]MDR8738768.1 hypothetical protein [Burkholderia pseudomultivorans]MDR8745399.1 hypothetical protein [Burkholderia pseudomultivorans]MDR8757507.1 hypothetical protein [Burkholderia pseudomultivorans]
MPVIAGLYRTNYLFRLYKRSVRKEQMVEFLKALKAQLKQPLLIIWYGAGPHWAAIGRDYLDSLDAHIHMTFLPPYCPEFNPVEYLWAWLKRHVMANFRPKHPRRIACHRSQQTQKRPAPALIIAACWIQATLW